MAIKYKWLAGRLRELIIRNIEKGNSKLPSEQELCKKYKVSRQTVRQALALLETEGLIEKRRGSGSYITGLFPDSHANTIDILISSDSEYIYPVILDDIHKTLNQSGFTERVHVTNNQIHTEREILHKLLTHPPRGAIVECCKSALPNPNLDLYYQLRKTGCVILFLHNYYPALDGSLYLKGDNAGGSMLLTEHLYRQGHTAIGGIFKSDDLQGIERYQGYVESMRDLHLPLIDDHINWFDSRDMDRLTKHHDTEFLKKIVQESLHSCTAVICYNDLIAYYLIKELQSLGHHLPEDISIAAFDNSYLSDADSLTLTTLSHSTHKTGVTAAGMMIERLKGLPVTSRELSWKLITGKSSQSSLRGF